MCLTDFFEQLRHKRFLSRSKYDLLLAADHSMPQTLFDGIRELWKRLGPDMGERTVFLLF